MSRCFGLSVRRTTATLSLAILALGAAGCGAGAASATLPSGSGSAAASTNAGASTSGATTSGGQAAGGGTAAGRVARPDVELLLTQATARAKAATSVAIVGDVTLHGSPVHMELVGRVDGSNAKVTVVSGGETTELLTVGERLWVKIGQSPSSTATASLASTVGKYVETPKSAMASQADALRPAAMLQAFTDPAKMSYLDKANLSMEDVTEQGRPAWLLGARVGGGRRVIIAADGTPDFLKVDSDTAAGSITLSQWNAVPPFSAPAATEIDAA